MSVPPRALFRLLLDAKADRDFYRDNHRMIEVEATNIRIKALRDAIGVFEIADDPPKDDHPPRSAG